MELKEQKLKDFENAKSEKEETLKQLEKLENAVLLWDKNLIDKRFFEKYFLIKLEYKDFTEFNFSEPQYYHQKNSGITHTIYLGNNNYLELKSRSTEELKEEIKKKKETIIIHIDSYKKTISNITTINEKDIIADIIAVYKKYDCPSVLWNEILKDYDVCYPENNN